MANTFATTNSLAVTVHGPAGVLDLVVPSAAAALDVAQEYARQSGLDVVPALAHEHGPADRGRRPRWSTRASTPATSWSPRSSAPVSRLRPSARRGTRRRDGHRSGRAVGAAVLRRRGHRCAGRLVRGAVAVRRPADRDRRACSPGRALLGVLPVGRFAAHRVVAAPAFAGGRGVRRRLGPAAERLPMVVGLTGLVAALAAAVGRALDRALRGGAAGLDRRRLAALPGDRARRPRRCAGPALLVVAPGRRACSPRASSRATPSTSPTSTSSTSSGSRSPPGRLASSRAASGGAPSYPSRRHRRPRDPRAPASSPRPARRSSPSS